MLHPTRTLAVLLLVLASCGGSVVHTRPDKLDADDAVTALWAAEIRSHARHGDWMLSRSYSFTGDLIAFGTLGESLSHAAMYDAERDLIIEATTPAVAEISLEKFLHRNRYVILVRPSGMTTAQRGAMVRNARAVVGHPFDYLSMLGLLNRPGNFYCTELLLWAAGMEQGRIVAPGELFEKGEVIYVSGVRETPQMMGLALQWRRNERRPSP